MGYIDSILEPKEQVIYWAKIHWAIYVGPVTIVAVGVGIGLLGFPFADYATYAEYAGGAVVLYSLLRILISFIRRRTTELSVTSNRVISKVGFIRRQTYEINRSKVEGIQVDQGIIERILGYGTVNVTGTGGGLAPMKDIDDPMTFRKNVQST